MSEFAVDVVRRPEFADSRGAGAMQVTVEHSGDVAGLKCLVTSEYPANHPLRSIGFRADRQRTRRRLDRFAVS